MIDAQHRRRGKGRVRRLYGISYAAAAGRSVANWCTSLERAGFDPMLKLRRNSTQEIAAYRILLA
jgi:hypothetical protein